MDAVSWNTSTDFRLLTSVASTCRSLRTPLTEYLKKKERKRKDPNRFFFSSSSFAFSCGLKVRRYFCSVVWVSPLLKGFGTLLPSFTEFLVGFVWFHWAYVTETHFYRVLPSFTYFSWFSRVLPGSTELLPSFTEFLVGFVWFHWVYVTWIHFYRVLLS